MPTQPSTIANLIIELIEAHMEKCDLAGDNPEDSPPHIFSEEHDTKADIADIDISKMDDAIIIYLALNDGTSFDIRVSES